MKCPKCEGDLRKAQIKVRPEYGADILNDAEQTSRIEVDQCLICNGIWFDMGELKQYLDEKLLILNSPRTDDYRYLNAKEGKCPRCGLVMVKKPAPKNAGFWIDVCEKCEGIWLDNSEIEKLQERNLSLGEKHALVFRNLRSLLSREEG